MPHIKGGSSCRSIWPSRISTPTRRRCAAVLTLPDRRRNAFLLAARIEAEGAQHPPVQTQRSNATAHRSSPSASVSRTTRGWNVPTTHNQGRARDRQRREAHACACKTPAGRPTKRRDASKFLENAEIMRCRLNFFQLVAVEAPQSPISIAASRQEMSRTLGSLFSTRRHPRTRCQRELDELVLAQFA